MMLDSGSSILLIQKDALSHIRGVTRVRPIPKLQLKTASGEQFPVQDFVCTQVQLDQLKVKHICCGGQISGTGNPRSRFSAKEWVDITTKPAMVHCSYKFDTALSNIPHTPVLPAAFHPAQRREAQMVIPSHPWECPQTMHKKM